MEDRAWTAQDIVNWEGCLQDHWWPWLCESTLSSQGKGKPPTHIATDNPIRLHHSWFGNITARHELCFFTQIINFNLQRYWSWVLLSECFHLHLTLMIFLFSEFKIQQAELCSWSLWKRVWALMPCFMFLTIFWSLGFAWAVFSFPQVPQYRGAWLSKPENAQSELR